jgi:hypothetical protein
MDTVRLAAITPSQGQANDGTGQQYLQQLSLSGQLFSCLEMLLIVMRNHTMKRFPSK